MLSAFSSYTQIFKLNLDKILQSLKATAKTISTIANSKTFYKDTDFKYCEEGLYVVDESISDNTHISFFNKTVPSSEDDSDDLNKFIKQLSIYSTLYKINCHSILFYIVYLKLFITFLQHSIHL